LDRTKAATAAEEVRCSCRLLDLSDAQTITGYRGIVTGQALPSGNDDETTRLSGRDRVSDRHDSEEADMTFVQRIVLSRLCDQYHVPFNEVSTLT
jgi:hypothetical protein